MSPTSTLKTPITSTLTLTRAIAPDAVTVEIHDETGTVLYAEDIAIRPAPDEPAHPEQAEPVL